MSTSSDPAESPEVSAPSEPTQPLEPSTPSEPAELPEASTPSKPGLLRRAAGLAWRHKVLSGITAAFVVAIIVVSAVTTGSPASSDNGSDIDPAAAAAANAGFPVPVTGSPVAAGFTVPLLGDSAKQVSLAQYAGKPVIVNFFASWCSPCQQETPLLAKWYKQQGGKVTVLGLDENDTTASAEKFVAAKGVSYPVGFDPNTIAAGGYGVNALPQTFFLNAQHHIVYHWDGAVDTAVLAQGLSLMNAAS
jgi:cytochrome c biogenesis protein CcmG, thiol:disulfide interchange protein DsbE